MFRAIDYFQERVNFCLSTIISKLKMKTLNKKGQNIQGAVSLVLGLFIIGILIFGLIFAGTRIKNSITERQSFLNQTEIVNLSGGTSNPTVTLAQKNANNPDIVCLSLRAVIQHNDTGFQIPNANFTFSGGSACTIRWNDNNTALNTYNLSRFNVSYDYDRQTNQQSVDVINQTNLSFQSIPPLFNVVAVFIMLTLILGLIFFMVRMFRGQQGSGV